MTLVLLALATITQSQAAAPSWPRWRGPNRDGISLETDWSAEGAAEPLWRAEVGPGYSNVAIADGRLFTLGYDRERGEDVLVCLDVETGVERWRLGWPEELGDTYHGGGTNSTPTVHGDVVFALGRHGQARALEVETGTVLWQHDYGSELELAPSTYGYAASPVLVGEALYLTCGATALCVDPLDGALRWRVELGARPAYTTPVPFEKDGRALLTNLSAEGLAVQDAATGAIVHRFPFAGQGGSLHACTPIVAGSDVLLSSAYNAGAVRIHLGSSETPEVVWSTKALRNKVSGCTLKDGLLYGFDESILKCLDFATGEERWRVRGLGMGSVAVAGDRLIVLTSKGELIVAPASGEGFSELSRQKVLDGGACWTTPVLLDGRIYARNSQGSLVCLDHRPASADRVSVRIETEPSELPAGLTLLAHHAELVGAKALAAHDSVRLLGTFEIGGAGVPPTPATLDRTATGWRLEWDLGEYGAARRVCDGELAWQEDAFFGTFLFEEPALREALDNECLSGPRVQGDARTIGLERFADRDCWAVAVSGPSGARRTLYFDTASGLLAGRSAPEEAMVVLADWRAFDGIQLPARITWLRPGTGAEETFRVESAQWDVVDPAPFQRPAWIARELRSEEQKAADDERLRAAHAKFLGTYLGPDGVRHAFDVVAGALALVVEGRDPDFVLEPDAEGRMFLESLPTAYLVFERDAAGRASEMRIEGLPGGEPFVCSRIDD
jgi:outer membrane protein assembly factor BamB